MYHISDIQKHHMLVPYPKWSKVPRWIWAKFSDFVWQYSQNVTCKFCWN